MITAWSRLRRAICAFRKETRGNVALTFAVAVIPVMACIGAAVDFSHANSVKVDMQAALDSTALMLSKNVASLTDTQLQTMAQNYFNALFNRPEATNVKITASYTSSGGTSLSVNGSATVPTSFLGLIGYNQMQVTDSTTTKWGGSRLRVALVLDNTGSMDSDGKIGALKTATKNLLTQLQAAASTAGDVYVSIVPFVKDVKVDTTGYSASWDSWIMWDDGTDSSWDGTNGKCSMGNKSPRSTCVAQASCSISGNNNKNSCQSDGVCSISNKSSQSSCTSAGTCSISGNNSKNSCENDGVCSKSNYTTQNKCTSKGYRWTSGVWTYGVWTAGVWTQAVWTPNNHSTWNGCVTERGSNSGPLSDYDRLTTAPSVSITASLFPAEQYSACPQAMMGLNYDWTSMNSLVDSMVANGSTNQPIGLVWGWQSLVGGGPLTAPAMDTNYTYQQIIILLSDGLNTQDRWYGNGSSTSTSVDYRMYDTNGSGTCANIKSAGITIYTIQVNTGGDPTSTLLQNCASNTSGTTDHFFLLTSADQIVTTFNTIGTNLTKLRLAM
jgi:Flp pilus assembly protein TadG